MFWLVINNNILQNGESKPVPAEKRSSIDEKPKKKTLPELDKYWKVVNDDPTDFTGWTYLLQYVDQEVSKNSNKYVYVSQALLVCNHKLHDEHFC